jgi:multidrug resistance efflux pump
VLDVIKEQKDLWEKRRDALEFAEGWAANVQETLDMARAEFAIEQAEAKVQKAKEICRREEQHLNSLHKHAAEAQDKAREAYQTVQAEVFYIANQERNVATADAKLRKAEAALAALKVNQQSNSETADGGGMSEESDGDQPNKETGCSGINGKTEQ